MDRLRNCVVFFWLKSTGVGICLGWYGDLGFKVWGMGRGFCWEVGKCGGLWGTFTEEGFVLGIVIWVRFGKRWILLGVGVVVGGWRVVVEK